MNTVPNILVIDDEAQIRRLLQLTLEPNYHLKFATTGKEGIIMAGSERLDLIILDLGLTGYRWIVSFKRNSWMGNSPDNYSYCA